MTNPSSTPMSDEELRNQIRSQVGQALIWLSEYFETGPEGFRFEHPADKQHFLNRFTDSIAFVVAHHTKEAVEAAIRATWYYTSEGYNGEYDGLTHIGGKRYTEDEVMGKVIADVMAELAAPTVHKTDMEERR